MNRDSFKKNLKSIFGDEFISEKIIDGINLDHVKLFHDHYHLKENTKKIRTSLSPS